MDTSTPTTTDLRKEDVEKLISACAEACGVGRETVEKICPASEEQIHRMDHHIDTGSSYVVQMVMHHEGDLNQNFLLRVLSAIRFKNHVLRTRLIKYEGKVYQVVLRDSIVFQQVGATLQVFLARNFQARMGYGTPLFRYAFIQEPHGESFFVWSALQPAHCSAIDAWTLRLFLDDLQTACSDLGAYCKSSPRPPFGRYARWLETRPSEAGLTFWLNQHTAFDNLVLRFPVLGLGGTPSTSTMKIKKLLHLPKVENIEFCLATMGHAAWALTMSGLLTQENLPLVSEDISFLSLISARGSDVPGIKHMMGPISARVPLRLHLFPNLPIKNLMRDIETQFQSMVGFEYCAMKALGNRGGVQSMLKQAVFNWHQPGIDISSKRIICHDKEAAPAVLAHREDLSVPYAHDYGLMIEVYEHGEHIAIYASWDHNLISRDLINRLLEDFGSLIMLIIKARGVTVLELLSENRADRSRQVANFQP